MKKNRLILDDETTWPNAESETFGETNWGLRYNPVIDQHQKYYASEVMAAYATLTTGTLEHAMKKIRMIKKAMKEESIKCFSNT